MPPSLDRLHNKIKPYTVIVWAVSTTHYLSLHVINPLSSCISHCLPSAYWAKNPPLSHTHTLFNLLPHHLLRTICRSCVGVSSHQLLDTKYYTFLARSNRFCSLY